WCQVRRRHPPPDLACASWSAFDQPPSERRPRRRNPVLPGGGLGGAVEAPSEDIQMASLSPDLACAPTRARLMNLGSSAGSPRRTPSWGEVSEGSEAPLRGQMASAGSLPLIWCIPLVKRPAWDFSALASVSNHSAS